MYDLQKKEERWREKLRVQNPNPKNLYIKGSNEEDGKTKRVYESFGVGVWD